MGRASLERYTGTPDQAIITIRSPGAPACTAVRHFGAVLHLIFSDIPWHDGKEHPEQFSNRQANDVIRFCEDNRTRRTLVVQCEAGVSRSVSLMMAIATAYGVAMVPQPILNYTVYRRTLEAFTRWGSRPRPLVGISHTGP